MTEKLPVRTIALHSRKKNGLLLGMVINLALAICFF